MSQRATLDRPDGQRLIATTFVAAQVGLAAHHWLVFAAGLPLPIGVALDQTIWTIPVLFGVLSTVRILEGVPVRTALASLGVKSWRSGTLWRTLRLNWLFWALFAKPFELGLAKAGLIAPEDLVFVDAVLVVVWYSILWHVGHGGDAPSPRHLIDRLMGQTADAGWNERTRVIWADLDDTLRPTFGTASATMVSEINAWLERGAMVVVTNSGWRDVRRSFVEIPSHPITVAHRHRLVLACANGAEIWGFAPGAVEPTCFWDEFAVWPAEVRAGCDALDQEILGRFPLQVVDSFTECGAEDDPTLVVRDRKGGQISYEMPGLRAIGLWGGMALNRELGRRGLPTMPLGLRWRHGLPWPGYDLRDPITAWGNARAAELGLPFVLTKGRYAVDLKLANMNKTRAVRRVLELGLVEQALGLRGIDFGDVSEAWGDHMSGPDADIVRALPEPAIGVSFSDEATFPPDVAPRIIRYRIGHVTDPVERALLRLASSRRTLAPVLNASPAARS